MNKSKLLYTNLLLLMVTLTVISCQQNPKLKGNDWATWRGPFANGTTNETHWDATLLSDSSAILWQANVGQGHSNIAIKGDKAYVFGNKQEIESSDTLYFDHISCLDASTGTEIWNYKYESDPGRFAGPGSSPIIEGNNLYALGRNGHLHCLNAASGELIWKQNITELGYQAPGFGFSVSPVIFNDMLLLKAGETGVAYNKENGQKLWSGDTTKYNSYSSVVVFGEKGSEKFALSNGDSLKVLDSQNGKTLISQAFKDIGSDPIIEGNTALVSNMEGTVLYDISGNSADTIWQNDSVKCLFQGFTKMGDYAYGFTRNKNKMPLTCISTKTGELMWEQDLDKWGSLIIADNKLVILTGNGKLIIANASPEAYTEISSKQIFEIDEEDFKKNTNCCWTIPVLSHGKIYARTSQGQVACVDVSI